MVTRTAEPTTEQDAAFDAPGVEPCAAESNEDETSDEVPEAGGSPRRRARSTPSDETPCADTPQTARIEALLLSSDRPLTEARIAALLGLPTRGAEKAVRRSVDELNDSYEKTGRAFRAERVAGGWQLLTNAVFGPLLARLHDDRARSKLSQAAMETLSIVAYRQPIIRAEIEAIRGVACGEVLRGLLERRLVKIVGRAEVLGRPMLYGTSGEFLKAFGLANLDDLPEVEGLERITPKPAARKAAAPGTTDEAAAPEAEPEAAAEAAADAAPDEPDATDATDRDEQPSD